MALLIVGILVSPVQAQVALGLTPMRMEFPAVAGKSYSGSLVLSNSSAGKVRVRAELLEFFVDSNQTPQFTPSASAENDFSCRHWLSMNPMEIEIDSMRQLSIRYTVRVPAAAAAQSYHCAIGFVSLPSAEELQGFAVRTAVRVVATIYPIVGNPGIEGRISELALEPVRVAGKLHWRGIVVMENTGAMLYRPKGSLQVVDADGRLVEAMEMISFPVLPRRRQRFILPLKNGLPEGHYALRARVDVGPEVQEASAEVSVDAPNQ